MTDEQKQWIDNASYEDLLEKWRNSPAGDPMFNDEPTFSHYTATMRQRRAEIGAGGAVAASKAVGWKGSKPEPQLTTINLLTTRPRADQTTFTKEALEKMALDLNDGRGSCHPLKAPTVKATVEPLGDGHFQLVITGEMQEGVTR